MQTRNSFCSCLMRYFFQRSDWFWERIEKIMTFGKAQTTICSLCQLNATLCVLRIILLKADTNISFCQRQIRQTRLPVPAFTLSIQIGNKFEILAKYSNHLRLFRSFCSRNFVNNFLCINLFRVFCHPLFLFAIVSCISFCERVLLTHVSPFATTMTTNNNNNLVVRFHSRIFSQRRVFS